jgi:glycosyltransferase involved in cell wall biosynthesis
MIESGLPTISIVVPNYNGGATIGRTLQSLVDQEYPALEIIVMDGGSTDNSVEVIRSFEKHLKYWVSATDGGQSSAINRGFEKATGDVLNWLCSDDLLLSGALATVGNYFAGHPDVDVLAGGCRFLYTYKNLEHIRRTTPATLALLPIISPIGQPSCFYRRRTLDRPGPLREELHYCLDMELWCHFQKAGRTWGFTDEILAEAIEDGNNKTSTGGLKIVAESERVYREYCHELIPMPFWYRHVQYPLRKFMTGSAPKPVRAAAHTLRRVMTMLLTPFYGFERLRTMENWYEFFEPPTPPRPQTVDQISR